MKLFKKIIVKIIHSLGFDIIRIPKDFENPFLGLGRYPIRSIIDIGANRGQFARRALQAFPNAHIYCFEPLKAPFKELQEWANEQDDRIFVFNLAIGDKEREVKMFLHSEHNDSSSILETTELSEAFYPLTKIQTLVSVKQTTLDKAISNLSEPLLPDILVKMDVQGYEDRVIRGGREILSRAKACILEVLLDSLYKNQASFKKIFLFMDKLGFNYIGNLEQVYASDGHVIYFDAVFVRRG